MFKLLRSKKRASLGHQFIVNWEEAEGRGRTETVAERQQD